MPPQKVCNNNVRFNADIITSKLLFSPSSDLSFNAEKIETLCCLLCFQLSDFSFCDELAEWLFFVK